MRLETFLGSLLSRTLASCEAAPTAQHIGGVPNEKEQCWLTKRGSWTNGAIERYGVGDVRGRKTDFFHLFTFRFYQRTPAQDAKYPAFGALFLEPEVEEKTLLGIGINGWVLSMPSTEPSLFQGV